MSRLDVLDVCDYSDSSRLISSRRSIASDAGTDNWRVDVTTAPGMTDSSNVSADGVSFNCEYSSKV